MVESLRRRLVSDIARLSLSKLTDYRFQGYTGAAVEHTYSIQDAQMNVHQPANADDQDITFTSNGAKSSTEPTIMSYALRRLQLGIWCREMTDISARAYFSGEEIDYQSTMVMGQKLENIVEDLPPFFKLSPNGSMLNDPIFDQRPQLLWQKFVLYSAYHTRRCRLHRKYFIRGLEDSQFSDSYAKCVESARKVIEVQRLIMDTKPSFKPHSYFFKPLVGHVFSAAIVLLLDVSAAALPDPVQREAVFEACRILDLIKLHSDFARKAIEELVETFRSHWSSVFENYDNDPLVNSTSSYEGSITMTGNVEDIFTDFLNSNQSFEAYSWENFFNGLGNNFFS
jgi:hypothetical protein